MIFAVCESALCGYSILTGNTILVASLDSDQRKDFYSSLTGSSSGLLGFALASVAILAAFGQRSVVSAEDQRREDHLARARADISKVLLVTSLLLMMVLIASTIGLGIDRHPQGNLLISSLVASSACASLIGLLVSGAGLALSLVERSSNS